jgi:uncharacterized protein
VKDLQRFALLIDFYGPLLTPRQQELMHAYYLEDLSLGEIAGEDGVSRQAVHDLIKRAEASLMEFEERLGFVAEQAAVQEQLAQLLTLLEQEHEGRPGGWLDQAIALVRELLQQKGE